MDSARDFLQWAGSVTETDPAVRGAVAVATVLTVLLGLAVKFRPRRTRAAPPLAGETSVVVTAPPGESVSVSINGG